MFVLVLVALTLAKAQVRARVEEGAGMIVRRGEPGTAEVSLLVQVNRWAGEMLRTVFAGYVQEPERLGDAASRRIESEGLERTVCDYLVGMTDRYLLEEHARLAAV